MQDTKLTKNQTHSILKLDKTKHYKFQGYKNFKWEDSIRQV